MKCGTAIGIVISVVGIAMGATMEGTNVMVVLNVPAIPIVLVGTRQADRPRRGRGDRRGVRTPSDRGRLLRRGCRAGAAGRARRSGRGRPGPRGLSDRTPGHSARREPSTAGSLALLAQGVRGQPHGPVSDGRLQPDAVDLSAR